MFKGITLGSVDFLRHPRRRAGIQSFNFSVFSGFPLSRELLRCHKTQQSIVILHQNSNDRLIRAQDLRSIEWYVCIQTMRK